MKTSLSPRVRLIQALSAALLLSSGAAIAVPFEDPPSGPPQKSIFWDVLYGDIDREHRAINEDYERMKNDPAKGPWETFFTHIPISVAQIFYNA
ncbi:hypothetical protein E3A20_06920, partial [Planctomyces bekefii]